MLTNEEALAQSLDWLLEEEGGWSNHKHDTGGATMYGVTQATYDRWRKSVGRPNQSVRNITHGESFELYRAMFWDEAGCDKLPFPISYMVFDAAVNSGPSRAIRWLQQALGTKADGKIGPETRRKLEAAFSKKDGTLIYRIVDQRLQFLTALIKRRPTQISFLTGWMRRLLRVQLRAALSQEV